MIRTAFVWPLAAFLLAACSAEDRAQMEADRLDKLELSDDERTIAEAYLVGWKKAARRDMLKSREYAQAACYAKSVKMPSSLHRAHLLYLEDYTAIDKDYYAFFKSKGISDSAAERMGNIYVETFESCTLGAMMKRAMSKD